MTDNAAGKLFPREGFVQRTALSGGLSRPVASSTNLKGVSPHTQSSCVSSAWPLDEREKQRSARAAACSPVRARCVREDKRSTTPRGSSRRQFLSLQSLHTHAAPAAPINHSRSDVVAQLSIAAKKPCSIGPAAITR
jgi:hypothetical protein